MSEEDGASESDGIVARVTAGGGGYLRRIKRVVDLVADPFKFDGELDAFSIPETQTTTVHGDVGWSNRPPAVVECSRCGREFDQRHARDPLDCPYCVAELEPEQFAHLELVALTCPRCGTELDHGRRHPRAFDVPQWAHCGNCQYHWEFTHSF